MPDFATDSTSRLLLRPLQPGDELFLACLDSDPDVMRHVHTGPLSKNSALEWARSQIEIAPHRRHLRKWMIELRDDPSKVGWIELSKFRGVFDPDESRLSDDISLGYQLAPAYWGRGIIVEAARPILARTFDLLELDRVLAFVRTAHHRSIRVLEKLGFQPSAAQHYKDESGARCILYSLQAPNFKAPPASPKALVPKIHSASADRAS